MRTSAMLVARQGLVEGCIEGVRLVEHDEVPGIVDHGELVARDGGGEPVPGGDEAVARHLALHVADDEDDGHLDLAEVGPEIGGEHEGDRIGHRFRIGLPRQTRCLSSGLLIIWPRDRLMRVAKASGGSAAKPAAIFSTSGLTLSGVAVGSNTAAKKRSQG